MADIFLSLLNMSLAAGIIAIAVMVLRVPLKSAPRKFVLLLWALVAIRLLCPFSFESTIGLLPDEPFIDQSVIEQLEAPQASTTPVTPDATPNTDNESTTPSMPTDTPAVTPTNTAPSPLDIAVVVWLCGMGGMLLYMAISYTRLRLRLREAVKVDGVWFCDRISGPFMLGLIRPRIYLPTTLPAEDLQAVIAHETAHRKRLDHLWKPLGFVLLSVHWFNPAL